MGERKEGEAEQNGSMSCCSIQRAYAEALIPPGVNLFEFR